ncbi:phosphatase PAP2 family protein [Methylobacterium sp. E-066]|uniref:phosphatase PAP2 family protein n=1 Tax=Methylobacterium sp. E-066 TaxID=2836584 RepID=UPI001FBA7F94|nr:phosphatase PAP2 family protein [Methylobacterium sp. E-066]MCJ2144529.1 phosphatase PAP2 family protein [Methylobacterium sp. E-066]
MRRRTYILLFMATALATLVARINNFQLPIFEIQDGIFLYFSFNLVFKLMHVTKLYYIVNFIRKSVLFHLIEVLAILVFAWSATVNLSYSIQIFALPLRDDVFLAVDRTLGFDYVLLMTWMSHHRSLSNVLSEVYNLFPPLIILLTLSDLVLVGDMRVGERFFTSALIAFLLAFIICALLPAAGAASLLDPDTAALATGATPLDRLYALRSGDAHQFGRGAAGGLVSFPSMHVAIAILALYAARDVRWLFLCVLPISLGFCVTALTHGGHYLVDCFAGAAVAAAAIRLNNSFHAFSALRLQTSRAYIRSEA